MSYDKAQASREFDRWSGATTGASSSGSCSARRTGRSSSGSRSPIGDRPWTVLDVGCGTGVFAARVRSAFPQARVWGVDLVAAMLSRAGERGDRDRAGRPGPGGQRTAPVPGRRVRRGDLLQQLPPLSAPGPGGRRDAPRPQAGRAAAPDRRLSRRLLGVVHLRRLRRRRRGGRPARLGASGPRPVRAGRVRRDDPAGPSGPGPVSR